MSKNKNIAILGSGESGVGAAVLAKKQGFDVFVSDFGKIKEEYKAVLEKENIESRPLWKPMHMQPIFSKYPSYVNGVSEDLFQKGLCLPSGSNLTKEDLNRVIIKIKDCIG